jgi:lipoate-protein ligase A
MAVDEALLESVVIRRQPTLRFYRWAFPTLSLGYFQRYADRTSHTASYRCQVVRRASGGGAILHHHDLTYSLVLPVSDRWSQAATSLYQEVHEALVDALADWGVDASLRGGNATGRDSGPFLCFLRQTDGDVVSSGVKIAGSAQRRAKGAVLQHGSVLFRTSNYAPELAGMDELSGLSVDRHELVHNWSAKLAEKLHVKFIEGALEQSEKTRSNVLVQQRFAAASWAYRR